MMGGLGQGANDGGNPLGMFFSRRNGPGATDPRSQGGDPNVNANIEHIIGTYLRQFQELFSGHQFLRMNSMFNGFSPDTFMSNFNTNFSSDNDFMEMARQMSEQEAQR